MENLDEMRFGTSGVILRYGEQILVVGMELGLPRSHLRDGRNAGGDGLCGHRMPPEPRRSRYRAFRGRRARDGLVHEAHLSRVAHKNSPSGLLLVSVFLSR